MRCLHNACSCACMLLCKVAAAGCCHSCYAVVTALHVLMNSIPSSSRLSLLLVCMVCKLPQLLTSDPLLWLLCTWQHCSMGTEFLQEAMAQQML